MHWQFQSCLFHTNSTTGWRTYMGCLQLQVSLCNRATKYRSLLRKMIYQDKSSYQSVPACTSQSPWGLIWKQNDVMWGASPISVAFTLSEPTVLLKSVRVMSHTCEWVMSRSTEHTVLFESVLSSRSGVNETCPLICANFIFNFKLYTLRVDLRHHVLRNCMCFQFEIWPFSVRISSILPLEFQSQFFASGQRRFVSPLPCRFD